MDKSTKRKPPPQVHQLMAGLLPGDHGTELFANLETRKVYGMRDGKRIAFNDLNPALIIKLLDLFYTDEVAMRDLSHLDAEAALEEFTFCLYGGADHEADFAANGTLTPPENFLCGENCKCMRWPSKNITLNGHPLTERQLEVCQRLASDDPDKKIAAELGISLPTLSNHKKEIFGKAGVHSKAGLIMRAVTDKVIQ